MSKTKRITASAPTQPTTRPQSRLDWNAPKNIDRTPSREYAFMGRFSLICGTQPHLPQYAGR